MLMRCAEALAKLRATCMALPDVTERPSHGMPAWFEAQALIEPLLAELTCGCRQRHGRDHE